jgi:hypothetical protein
MPSAKSCFLVKSLFSPFLFCLCEFVDWCVNDNNASLFFLLFFEFLTEPALVKPWRSSGLLNEAIGWSQLKTEACVDTACPIFPSISYTYELNNWSCCWSISWFTLQETCLYEYAGLMDKFQYFKVCIYVVSWHSGELFPYYLQPHKRKWVFQCVASSINLLLR